jgi:excisionase family DNA binding protein
MLVSRERGGGDMLTPKELMEQLKISDSTLYRLRKEGLPYKKVGYRTIRYDLVEVMEWLEKNNKGGK